MVNRQRGMTMLGFVLIAILVGVIAYAGVRLAPAYLNQLKIRQALNGLKTEFDGQAPTAKALSAGIARRLEIDLVEFPTKQDFQINKTEDGFHVSVSYEERVPYISNIFLVAVFDNSVEIRR